MTILIFVFLTLVSLFDTEEMYMILQNSESLPRVPVSKQAFIVDAFKVIQEYKWKYKMIINILLKIKSGEMDSDIEMPHIVSIKIYYKAAENKIV